MNISSSEITSWLSARSIPLAILLLLSFPTQASEAVGKLQFVAGEVQAISPDGTIRPLKKGDRLYTGDTIKSGAGGTAQVIMRDRSRLLVRTDTAIQIKKFSFDSKKPQDAKSVIALKHGAVRSVSSPGGKGKAGEQIIETPLAIVGAAIGDREVIHVEPGATGTPTAKSRPLGTFSKIYAGEAVVESPQGTLRLGLQQVGHVGGKFDQAKRPVTIGELPPPIEERISAGKVTATTMSVISHKGSGHTTTTGTIDVTKVPTQGVGAPIPIPYPNVGETSAGGKQKSKINVSNDAIKSTNFKTSSGDEPGAAQGIISNKNMDKITIIKHSGKVTAKGKSVTRLLSTTSHNGSTANTPPGIQITPSQTKVKVAP